MNAEPIFSTVKPEFTWNFCHYLLPRSRSYFLIQSDQLVTLPLSLLLDCSRQTKELLGRMPIRKGKRKADEPADLLEEHLESLKSLIKEVKTQAVRTRTYVSFKNCTTEDRVRRGQGLAGRVVKSGRIANVSQNPSPLLSSHNQNASPPLYLAGLTRCRVL